MPGKSPRYAVNATSLPHSSVWDDIADAASTGADGLGLWERKIAAGDDAEVAARLRDAGLRASFCVPALHLILPSQIDPPGAPRDIGQRVGLICASIRRLAAFDPVAVVIGPGASGDPDRPAGPVEDVLAALPQIAATAVYHSWDEPGLHDQLRRYLLRRRHLRHQAARFLLGDATAAVPQPGQRRFRPGLRHRGPARPGPSMIRPGR